MKNKKLVLAALIAVMVSMTGCGSMMKQGMKETEETIEIEETVEESEEEIEEEIEDEIEEESEEVDAEDESEEAEEDQEASKTEEEEEGDYLEVAIGDGDEVDAFTGLSYYVDQENGYIGNDTGDVEELMQYVEIRAEELSQENMDKGEDVLYHFTMYNQAPAKLVETGSSSSYLTMLQYEDESFIVMFGSDAVDEEEIEVFCQEGTTIDYWAYGVVEGDVYILVPLIAGNDANGYYIVRPAFISMGADMSGMQSLVEQGIVFINPDDYVEDDVDDVDVEDDDDDSDDGVTGEETLAIEITDINNDGGIAEIFYVLESTYPMDLILDDVKYFINGEDVTDDVTAFITVEGNGTVEDSIYMDNYVLHVGDEFVIRGTLVDAETFERMDEIEFVFDME